MKKVLIIEDHPDLRELLRRELPVMGVALSLLNEFAVIIVARANVGWKQLRRMQEHQSDRHEGGHQCGGG
jgi:CheY-like chemotaxis protein